MVCHAATAKQILTRRFRIISCSVLLVVTLGPSLVAAYISFIRRNFTFCLQGFYGGVKIRFRVDNSLYFFLPALVSLVLYFRVGLTLMNSRAQRSRNRSLTQAFLVSTLLWIILWLPQTLFLELFYGLSFEEISKMGYTYFIAVKVRTANFVHFLVLCGIMRLK